MRKYLQHIADRRLEALDLAPVLAACDRFDFIEPQDVHDLTSFFERKVSAYQVGVTGDVAFSDEF